MGIAALICGILSLVFCWVPFLGPILGLCGIIFGIIAMKKGKKGLGIGGLITGALGLIAGIIIYVVAMMAAAALTEGLGDLEAQLNDPALQQQLNDSLNQAMQEAAQQAAPPQQ